MEYQYIGVQKWMVSELGLTGNELLVYAIIYGASQDGVTRFCGTLKYIAEWTGCSRKTVIRILTGLVEKGLIDKKDEGVGGITLNSYAVITPVGTKLHPQGQNVPRGDKMTPGISPSSPLCSPSPFPPETPITTTPIIPTTPSPFPSECSNSRIINNSQVTTHTVSPQGECIDDLVQRVYDAYPARDVPTSDYPKGRSLAKCGKDKEKIAKLLKEGKYTVDMLVDIIRQEVEEHPRGYMKNFSTFLNNIPEYIPKEKKIDKDKERAIWIAHGSKPSEMPLWMKKERGLI